MAAKTNGSGRTTLTEINVTPLVDVMLVLLIIFMVTAPLIQQGVEVSLPEVRAKQVDAQEQKLVLSIRADHSLWLGTSEDAARPRRRPAPRGSRARRPPPARAGRGGRARFGAPPSSAQPPGPWPVGSAPAAGW